MIIRMNLFKSTRTSSLIHAHPQNVCSLGKLWYYVFKQYLPYVLIKHEYSLNDNEKSQRAPILSVAIT